MPDTPASRNANCPAPTRRAAGLIALSAVIGAALGGCGGQGEPLKARIAKLEEANLALRGEVADLDRKVAALQGNLRREKDVGICMRILFQLPAKWKQRLRLDLLDFSAGDMNAGVMAEADVAEGRFNVLTGGLTSIWGKRAEVLQEKHDIWVMHIAGPNDGEAVFRLIKRYDAISRAAIDKKHGKGFLDNVFKRKE